MNNKFPISVFPIKDAHDLQQFNIVSILMKMNRVKQ